MCSPCCRRKKVYVQEPQEAKHAEHKTVRFHIDPPPPTPTERTVVAAHQRFISTEQVSLTTALRQPPPAYATSMQVLIARAPAKGIPPREAKRAE